MVAYVGHLEYGLFLDHTTGIVSYYSWSFFERGTYHNAVCEIYQGVTLGNHLLLFVTLAALLRCSYSCMTALLQLLYMLLLSTAVQAQRRGRCPVPLPTPSTIDCDDFLTIENLRLPPLDSTAKSMQTRTKCHQDPHAEHPLYTLFYNAVPGVINLLLMSPFPRTLYPYTCM